MSAQEWRCSLKVGDEVLVSGQHGPRCVRRVTHATKLHVTVEHDKFRRSTGRLVGGDMWSSMRIDPVTDEARAEIRRRVLAVRLGRANWWRETWADAPGGRTVIALLDALDARDREIAELRVALRSIATSQANSRSAVRIREIARVALGNEGKP